MDKSNMKAIGLAKPGTYTDLQVLERSIPPIGSHDILVEVKAVSLNPVDLKKLKRENPSLENPIISGYDASGVVVKLGSDVKCFKIGDEVFYAGSVIRQGSFANFHAVDSRIVGRKPSGISHALAAGVPLVALTAWEGMIDRMEISQNKDQNTGKTIVIVNGAGGVGSIAIQIAKQVLGLKVIASASRPETEEFVKKCGADVVINHRNRLLDEIQKHGIKQVDYVFHCHEMTKDYIKQFSEIVRPFGKVLGITNSEDLNMAPLMSKAIAFFQELMFVRPIYGIELERQGEILNTVSDLIDKKVLFSTVTETMKFSLENIIKGEEKIDKATVYGKISFENVDAF